MAKQKKSNQPVWDDSYLKTAPCVPTIRNEVAAWRGNDYQGITPITRELFNYWFQTQKIGKIRYHKAQQEAVETLVYLHEVKKIGNRKDLLNTFMRATNPANLRMPPPEYDAYTRYAVKMATGSGKTKVMSLVIAWQFANAVLLDLENYAKTFLIIAPNTIVFDRLQTDFVNGAIFNVDKVFPQHLLGQGCNDIAFYMRGDAERASTSGAIYLTNVQQLYASRSTKTTKSKAEEPDFMTELLGVMPPTDLHKPTSFVERLAEREGLLMVLNDEAHHTHEEDNEWNKTIQALHQKINLAAQLDFSATPRYTDGSLFAWTVYDYTLRQAIEDQIVKRPIKGVADVAEAASTEPEIQYEGYLVAAVERWKEYVAQLVPLNKKPVLFVMMDKKDNADKIGAWLAKTYPQHFAVEKTLIVHTDTQGEVMKGEQQTVREASKQIDDNNSPVNAIVSVLMLREGWDVKNVTVVLGLRAYSAKANILPEQTIGRGLRLMLRGESQDYIERVDIIGNGNFMEFLTDLENLEGYTFDTFKVGKDKLNILTIYPVESKQDKDIGLPILTEFLVRKSSIDDKIKALVVQDLLLTQPIPFGSAEIAATKTFIYEGRDLLTDRKEVEREYTIPHANTSAEVIGYYTELIIKNLKTVRSTFEVLSPKIKEFLQYRAFGRVIENLDEPAALQAIQSDLCKMVLPKLFDNYLRKFMVEEKEPTMKETARYLSSTKPFAFGRKVIEADKTVFNLVACDNEFEAAFAEFAQKVPDVEAFAKLPEVFGFTVQYTDNANNLRLYYPDFVLKLSNGNHFLIETKGREDTDVKKKDEAAKLWCEKVTELTGNSWQYRKVKQEKMQTNFVMFSTFAKLLFYMEN
jgi:type III restriction enzyme